MTRTARAVTAALVLLLASHASAANLFGPPERITVYLASGRSIQTSHGQATTDSLRIELTRDWSPRTEVGFIIAPMNVQEPRSWFGNRFGDPDQTARGAAFSLLLRRDFFPRWKSMEPYAEILTGPMYTTRAVPAATSRFNFLSEAGVGAVLLPRNRFNFVIGYRFAHISNAGLASRNPGLNVHTLLFGTRFHP